MLGFVKTAQAIPEKRPATERRGDFDEIYQAYAADKAAEQANRCSQCGVPFCQIHCPLQNNIPDWLKLTAEGRLEEAYALSSATNTFPEICGRICPQDRLCEGNCVIEKSGHGTVTIGSIEKYITDTAWERGWVVAQPPKTEKPQSIGIIGAGPAGLAAAEQLRRAGYRVDVYDAYDRIGGLLIYGIPNFKLDKDIVARRGKWLGDHGIRFHLNTRIGRDISFAQLRQTYDAVLIATGVYQARPLAIEGENLPGVVAALDYLTANNKAGLGDDLDKNLDAQGKKIVVIGGGDTAMDCVRTAIRQGATSVRCLYRRDRINMPGSQREVSHAEEEGVIFEWMMAPSSITGHGRAEQVVAQAMRLGLNDGAGRRRPEAVPGDIRHFAADMVITALGFEAEDLPKAFDCADLPVTSRGTIAVNPATMMTGLAGVFAAGDIVRGASLVVWGIKDGRDAATGIDQYLQQKAQPVRHAAE